MKSWLLLFLGFVLVQANQDALLAVKQANNLFSSQLYDILRREVKDNLIASPLSISTVFAMCQAGARGETVDALRSTFRFPADDQLYSGYQSLLQQLQSQGSITLERANRIYPAKGYPLNREFSATLKNYFAAEPHQLNFGKNVEAAREINAFVNQSTHGKIPKLIEASALDEGTKLVVVNAIYFKGTWKKPFPKEDTREMDFYTSETASVKVDMMRLETAMLYGEIPELDAQAVSLPYEGGRWSMIVLLPNKRTGLPEMEEKLKSFPLNKIMASMRKREVVLNLPKYKLESTFMLAKPLTQLGAGAIFNAVSANFSGIPAEELKASEKLYVSEAIHKAFIEVNEEGSETAGATGTVFVALRFPIGKEPTPIVRVDHPFYSMIVHGDSNTGEISPVFIQRVARIQKGQ